jgi:predicted GNAT family N-acyltransferase
MKRNKQANWLIRRADWSDESDRNALPSVRRTVFIVEQQVPESLEWDADDAIAIHLLAMADDQAVGTARILPDGRIGRLAVLKCWRGQGIGKALLLAAIEHCNRRPFLHAQVHAIPFYAAAGFVPSGAPFDEAGIPHQLMIMNRAGT